MPKIIYLSYPLGALATLILSLLLVKLVGDIGIAVALLLSEFIIVGYNFIAFKMANIARV